MQDPVGSTVQLWAVGWWTPQGKDLFALQICKCFFRITRRQNYCLEISVFLYFAHLKDLEITYIHVPATVIARKHRDNGLDSANDIPKIRYKVIKILVFMNEDKNLISQNLSYLNCSVSFEAPID